jgi:hypothetical protein
LPGLFFENPQINWLGFGLLNTNVYSPKSIAMSLDTQIIYVFILSIPVACIAWTVTHEELFKEPRQFCMTKSMRSKSFLLRKFFYMLTCEYCFSHYVTVILLVITNFYLLYNDWRGYIIAGFSIVWIANIYISLFYLLRQSIKKEKAVIEEIQGGNK